MGAPSECYIDPATGLDAPGRGTIGSPYATFQYAHNDFTFDATNGTRYNVKEGTPDVTGNVALSLTVRSAAAPGIIQGYTSVAGDGGRGHINTGTANITATWPGDWQFHDMVFSGLMLYAGYPAVTINCVVNGNMSAYSGNNRIIGNRINGKLTVSGNFNLVYGNVIVSTGDTILYLSGSYIQCSHNVVIGTALATSNRALACYGGNNWVTNNIVYVNAGHGINCESSLATVCNNIIQGATYALVAAGTPYLIFNNAAYNCGSLESLPAGENSYRSIYPNYTLSTSPFVDAPGGDFRLVSPLAGFGGNLGALQSIEASGGILRGGSLTGGFQ